MNCPALQWIPRQAHRPSRKSSKQWEKHSTLFLDKRPPQLPARCGKRQQRKEWWQRLKWGFTAWPGTAGNGIPPPHSLEYPGNSHCGALNHCNTYPQRPPSCQKGLFPNAFSQYWAFFKSTQKGKGHRKAEASPAGTDSCQSYVMLAKQGQQSIVRSCGSIHVPPQP